MYQHFDVVAVGFANMLVDEIKKRESKRREKKLFHQVNRTCDTVHD